MVQSLRVLNKLMSAVIVGAHQDKNEWPHISWLEWALGANNVAGILWTAPVSAGVEV
jgi:hypothetical protein